MTGHFIVFEGVEGCGKTTQLRYLHQWLTHSHDAQTLIAYDNLSPQVITTREPGGTELGQMLRGIVLGQEQYQITTDIHSRTELLLYAADRAQHVDDCLLPHLQQGAIILCDRYTDSTIAYQGYGRGLDRALIDQLNAIATQGLQSDLTLWLDLEVELGLERMQKRGPIDRMEQTTINFHRRVQQGFQDLAQAYPERIVRIDASGTPEQVAQRIQVVVSNRLGQWYPSVVSKRGMSNYTEE